MGWGREKLDQHRHRNAQSAAKNGFGLTASSQKSQSLEPRNVVRRQGGAVPQRRWKVDGKMLMIGVMMGGEYLGLHCGDEGII